MINCSIKNCKNRIERNVAGVSYHRFPLHKIELQTWIKACGRPNGWTPTKHARVCSIHFEKHLFTNVGNRNTLKPFAVPTIAVFDARNSGPFITISPIVHNQTNKKNFLSAPLKTDRIVNLEEHTSRSIETDKQSGETSGQTQKPNRLSANTQRKPIELQETKKHKRFDLVSDNNHVDGIQCHYCKNLIPGFVYTCLECDYQMCHLCNVDSVHANHYILRGPFGKSNEEVESVKKKITQILKPSDLEIGSHLNDKILPMDLPLEETIKTEEDLDIEDMLIKSEIKIEEQDPLEQLDMAQTSSYVYEVPFSDQNVTILTDHQRNN